MSTKPLTGSFQQSVIRLMTEEELFCQRCCLYLHMDYFNNQYLAWFFKQSREYFDTYNKIPSIAYLTDKMKNLDPEKMPQYAQVLSEIEKAGVRDKEYIVDELEMFIKTSKYKKLHLKAAELFNSGEYSEAFDFTRDRMTKIDEIKLKQDDHITDEMIGHIVDSLGKEEKSGINIMGMSFPDLNGNPTWDGCIPRRGVTTIIAPWNCGKTIFMMNCAIHAASAGNKVLFIFHEGIRDQIVIKFLSRLTGIPYNSIKAGALNEEDHAKIKLARQFIKQNIRIKEVTKIGNTVEDLAVYCKTIKQEYDFDILIDDYAQKLGVRRPKNQLRHDYLHIWNTLDQIAHELDIAILTAAQVNRDGSKMNKKGNGILRSESISETIAPAITSEVVLTLNRSSKDRIDDVLVVCLDKGRDSLDGLLIQCNTCFSRMLTHSSEYGMTITGYDTGESDE